MSNPTFNDSVFVNCPFDTAYMPMLRAIVFTIYRCGFFPKSALEEDNALDNRIDKINRLIENCKYGVHDISRTEVNSNNLPRFNMPFELGLFFGAKRFGNRSQKTKNAMIFEKVKYSYQQYLSDLSGVDTKAHNNDPALVIPKLRDWLRTSSRRTTIPGPATILNDFNELMSELPAIASDLGYTSDAIPFNEYCGIVEEFIKKKIS